MKRTVKSVGMDLSRRRWRSRLVARAWRPTQRRHAQLGPQELVTKVAQDTSEGSRCAPRRVQEEPEARARAGRQEHAAALRHDVRGAARAREALAHGDAGAAQALRRGVLPVAAAELRRGAARVHAGPPEDPAVPGQGRRHGRDGAQRSPARQRQRVPVNYSLRKTADGWKAYDVQIEGVSYVKSFRTDFGSEIQQKGLEPVIQRLEQQVASGTVQKPTAPAGTRSSRRPRRNREQRAARSARHGPVSRQRRARCDDRRGRAGAERGAFRAGRPQIEVDLGGVGESDSAGLALLIEWLRMARQSGKQISSPTYPRRSRRWRASAKSRT